MIKRIGLSLGADICWPLCYEQILERLDLSIPVGNDAVRFEVERVTIEPFNLRQDCRYDLVIDRLTHWYHTSREWIKKAVLMNDLYVLNNPWSVQSMEKHTSYCAMMRLGFRIPDTWMVPPKSYEPSADLDPTLRRYARLFDLGSVGDELGYPMYMKPYDGGAWRGVSRIDDGKALQSAYEQSGKSLMHLQRGVEPFDRFVRCIGLGPQVRYVSYDPAAPHHDRYTMERDFLSAGDRDHLRSLTLVINAFFGWEFNSCESLRAGDLWHPIDFANPCPDSQVSSLHYHFPWMLSSLIRWTLFCAATDRPMRRTLDWQPYFDIADTDRPFEDKLRAYTELAEAHFDTARFTDFCDEHLPHLDEVVWDYFGSPHARDAVWQKVRALFPDHEVEQFTDLFWERIGLWREHNPLQGRES